MPQFITDPATVYGLLGYAIFASLACGLNFILWRTAHNENERNSDLADQLDYKVKALRMAEEESADVIVNLKHKVNDLTELLYGSRAANKKLYKTNAHMHEILSRAYVRNRYGILQAYQDWAINGDKKPKPRKPSATSNQKRNG
jgi:hypothetical protein